MAASLQTDFKIYQEQFNGGFVEVLQQNGAAFNGASLGAIVLRSEMLRGNYAYESFFDLVSGLIERRDTTSVAADTDTAVTQDEFVSVKLDRRLKPTAVTLDAMKKISKDPREISFILGQQAAVAVQLDQLNTALLACEAALDAQTALKNDVAATGGAITSESLITMFQKAGDSAAQIAVLVMHSSSYYPLLKDQVTDAVYRANGVQIMQGTPATFGRPVIVTDSTALVEEEAPSSAVTSYSVLGLRAGAIEITISEPPTMVTELVTGHKQLFHRVQGEHSFNLGLKGMKWDVTNGGVNPLDSVVGTGSNWVKAVTSDKLLPGVILKHV